MAEQRELPDLEKPLGPHGLEFNRDIKKLRREEESASRLVKIMRTSGIGLFLVIVLFVAFKLFAPL